MPDNLPSPNVPKIAGDITNIIISKIICCFGVNPSAVLEITSPERGGGCSEAVPPLATYPVSGCNASPHWRQNLVVSGLGDPQRGQNMFGNPRYELE
jgi:hypothetical protein